MKIHATFDTVVFLLVSNLTLSKLILTDHGAEQREAALFSMFRSSTHTVFLQIRTWTDDFINHIGQTVNSR